MQSVRRPFPVKRRDSEAQLGADRPDGRDPDPAHTRDRPMNNCCAPVLAVRRRLSPARAAQIDMLVQRSEDIAVRASEAMAAVRDLLTDENIPEGIRCMIADLQHHLVIALREEAFRDQRAPEKPQAPCHERSAIPISASLARADPERFGDASSTTMRANQVNAAAQVKPSGQDHCPNSPEAAEQISRAANAVSRVANGNLEDRPVPC